MVDNTTKGTSNPHSRFCDTLIERCARRALRESPPATAPIRQDYWWSEPRSAWYPTQRQRI
jgi:hypothetical protein